MMLRILLILSALCFLSACQLAGQKDLYVIKLLNGELLYSKASPKEQEGHYVFDDVNGQQYIIRQQNVLSIQRERFQKP